MKKLLLAFVMMLVFFIVGCSEEIKLDSDSTYIVFEYLNEDASINDTEGYIFDNFDEFKKYSEQKFRNPENLNISESIDFNNDNLLILTMKIENEENGVVYNLDKIKVSNDKLKIYLEYIGSVASRESMYKSLVQTASWIIRLDKDVTPKEVIVIKK